MWFFPHINCVREILLACAWVLLLLFGGRWGEVSAQSITNTDILYITSGTTFFMGGNFINNAGATTEDQGTLRVVGNWTNNGTFTPGSGSVIFSGSTEQTLTKPGGETFYRLIINNSSATGVVLNNSATITDSLTLTDGILYASASNLLTIANGARSDTGRSASFVHGPLRKIGNQAFVFPVGDSTVWARLEISAPSVVSDEFTAQYFDTIYSDLSTDVSLNNMSDFEYWTLDRNVGASNVTVKLYWEDMVRSGITDVVSGDLVVARYNGVDWTSESQLAITSSSPGDVTSNTVSTFSPFTFGSLSGSVNPLPITLLDFTAGEEGQTVRVLWTTAIEINNDFFTVERSVDAVIFNKLTEIPGAGNSHSILNYSVVDDAPFSGVSYYRLKQTDFDGSFTYSNIALVNLEVINLVNIYPVPAGGSLTVFVFSSIETNMGVEIIDIIGRKVLDADVALQEGKNEISLDISDIATGIYVLNIATESGQYKIQKEFVVTTYR